jgi:peptide deformylase
MKIVKNKSKLRIPTKECESVSEGIDISEKLKNTLQQTGGIGLSANQIGIGKSVCIVAARKNQDPLVLINPRCVEASTEKVIYFEGCLSIPGKSVKTIRHKTVTIACDNWENEITFGPDSTDLTQENYWSDEGLLESVCVQHEMGHLDGQLITDNEVRFPQENLKISKIGRNQNVMVKKGDHTEFLKFKKAQKLLQDGWEII